jgi:hypothetical protein
VVLVAQRLQVLERVGTALGLARDVVDVGARAGAPSACVQLDVLADRLATQLPSPKTATPTRAVAAS